MTAEAASFSVLTEQPMLKHFGLRNAAHPEGTAGVADLFLSMHADLQQEPTAVDFVSCFAAGNRDYDTVFGAAALSAGNTTSTTRSMTTAFPPSPLAAQMRYLMM